MFNIILYQPEIPPNTGNVIRLCANTGMALHLIEPLGFEWDDKRLRRAGLDYHEFASVSKYPSLQTYIEANKTQTIYACTTKGSVPHSAPSYQSGDAFLFGPETRGLPADILQSWPNDRRIRIPMKQNSRSLNLSNAVSIIAYEALRQQNFGELF